MEESHNGRRHQSWILVKLHNFFEFFLKCIWPHVYINRFTWGSRSKRPCNLSFLNSMESPSLSKVLFIYLLIFKWRIIALQYYVGFCHISTWISHRCIYMSPPSRTSLSPSTPSHPSRLSQSTGFELPESYSKFPLAILHMIVYMFLCYCLHSSHPLLLPGQRYQKEKLQAQNGITCSIAHDSKTRFNTYLIAVPAFSRNGVLINQSGIFWSAPRR